MSQATQNVRKPRFSTGPQIWSEEGAKNVLSHVAGDFRLRTNRSYMDSHPGVLKRVRKDVRDRVDRIRDFRRRSLTGKAVAA